MFSSVMPDRSQLVTSLQFIFSAAWLPYLASPSCASSTARSAALAQMIWPANLSLTGSALTALVSSRQAQRLVPGYSVSPYPSCRSLVWEVILNSHLAQSPSSPAPRGLLTVRVISLLVPVNPSPTTMSLLSGAGLHRGRHRGRHRGQKPRRMEQSLWTEAKEQRCSATGPQGCSAIGPKAAIPTLLSAR